jgi:hypothetical protein
LDPFFQDVPFVAPPSLGHTTVERIGRSCREWIAIVESANRLRFDHVGFFC